MSKLEWQVREFDLSCATNHNPAGLVALTGFGDDYDKAMEYLNKLTAGFTTQRSATIGMWPAN
jgi:hypothetical protein